VSASISVFSLKMTGGACESELADQVAREEGVQVIGMSATMPNAKQVTCPGRAVCSILMHIGLVAVPGRAILVLYRRVVCVEHAQRCGSSRRLMTVNMV
jgi:hypothetical protein